MRWIGAQDSKPKVSVHLYSPEITVTNGSNSNLLLGYVDVEVNRPTPVKSLNLMFAGIYSACWVEGTGQSRQEYYQNKRFHCDSMTLTQRDKIERFQAGPPAYRLPYVDAEALDRWGPAAPLSRTSTMDSQGRSRSSSTSSQCSPNMMVGGVSRDLLINDSIPAEHVQPPRQPRAYGHRTSGWGSQSENSDDGGDMDMHMGELRHADSVADMHSSSRTRGPAYEPERHSTWHDDANNRHSFSDQGESFELAPGKHKFRFCFSLPPRMPSTVVSQVGGIDYSLNVHLKTRSTLGCIQGSSVRAMCPVHVVNLPSRFAQMQADLPLNDEAVFTKQIDQSWWIMAKLSSRTASPGDLLKVSVSVSWPAKCDFEESTAPYLKVVGLKMDLMECTIYKSMSTGNVIKRIEVPVASHTYRGSEASKMSEQEDNSNIIHVQNSAIDLVSLSQAQGTKSPRPANRSGRSSTVSSEISFQSAPAVRGLFNEDFASFYDLQIPRLRQTGSKLRNGAIHIDCRSAPVSVIHELRASLQVFDKTTDKLHSIPFHTRVVIVPEAETFFLPAYNSCSLDTRVM
ncbi:hypothetical protein GGI07_001966 [Coemansia sp. Benny D115]|nr:hypothetical protein GGI07_001966 [Coemansia sp. Benny D115]